ncbi:hypothetical protein [Arthrobacter sp. NA-172]|uniref:hypothetical protein n=1 Tax=Arthrobacter sp. NA-172 TaxID=3367524 RepID=UPI003754362C
MKLLRRRPQRSKRGLRAWWFGVIALLSLAVVLLVLARPPAVVGSEAVPPSSVEPSPASTEAWDGSPQPPSSPTATSMLPPPVGEPRTTDYRQLAEAAATAIYTWDTRAASYSDVYSRLRDWWVVLPDGSNPLPVFVKEFEATGVNAGTYASLKAAQARRSATVQSHVCDSELAKVREHPAPWNGLHVCTVTLSVVDQSNSDRNAYMAPVSVMVNCPPATTAPVDHCVLVGFYATPSRIVY